MIKRLYADVDEGLLREAWQWDKDAPQWYRRMDALFGPQSEDEFIAAVADDIVIGIFQDGLCGVLVLEQQSPHVFSTHLWAKRGTSVELLGAAATQVMYELFDLGMQEALCWVAEKNLAVRRLCGIIGLTHEGILMYRGSYKGKLTKWLRYSVRAEVVSKAIAA